MNGFHEAGAESFRIAIERLLGMPPVTVERWEAVNDALGPHRKGLEFVDALHWASSRSCERFVSLDDRRFVRPPADWAF